MNQQGFTLSSPAFANDEFMPSRYTCDGDNVAPPLQWRHPPDGVASFALVMEDRDASASPFTHWLLFDLPPDCEALRSGEADPGEAGTTGRNSFQFIGYGGPCPAPNQGQHRYRFTLYALDVETLGLGQGANAEAVALALENHELGRAELMARYERKAR